MGIFKKIGKVYGFGLTEQEKLEKRTKAMQRMQHEEVFLEQETKLLRHKSAIARERAAIRIEEQRGRQQGGGMFGGLNFRLPSDILEGRPARQQGAQRPRPKKRHRRKRYYY